MRTLKTSLATRALRAPIVLLAALSWLAVSNHCALAAFQGSAGMAAAPSCHAMHHGHAPAKQNKEADVECCKVLRATLPTLSKSLVAPAVSTFAIQHYFIALVWMVERPRLIPAQELDTGPPAGRSFAEAVLQRSLLAHAPPSLA